MVLRVSAHRALDPDGLLKWWKLRRIIQKYFFKIDLQLKVSHRLIDFG